MRRDRYIYMQTDIIAGTDFPSYQLSDGSHRTRLLRDVLSPMRDGTKLAMDILRPVDEKRYPVILVRTPYDKVRFLASPTRRPFLDKMAARGYVVIAQDCRGRSNSDGEFDAYRQEHDDGYDTIEWIAKQPWCDGNVGMIGRSYEGQTQWFAAAKAPPALKAIVPFCSPPGNAFANEPIWGGAMTLAMAEWAFSLGRRTFQIPDLQTLFEKDRSYFYASPLSAIAEAAGTQSPFWEEWLRHPMLDEFWLSCGYDQYRKNMTVPALNVTGWWDLNFSGAPDNFVRMRQDGTVEKARTGQRLVIGPWPHWPNMQRSLNGVDFGENALVDLDGYTMRFLDYWLKGDTGNGLDDEPSVHVFVLGANEWWSANEWPLPGTQFQSLYLDSGGHANSHDGDGLLSWTCPDRAGQDSYVSDPSNPVRTIFNMHDGPVDDRAVTGRSDILCYTSEVFYQPVDIVGPVELNLHASSSAADCDWHVRLVDVYPDGTARFLSRGVLRARFRSGFNSFDFPKPDQPHHYKIDLGAIGVRLLPGHRFRVEICSSWFNRFDINAQTGAHDWMASEMTPVVANQTIHHGPETASHVIIPVIKKPVDAVLLATCSPETPAV